MVVRLLAIIALCVVCLGGQAAWGGQRWFGSQSGTAGTSLNMEETARGTIGGSIKPDSIGTMDSITIYLDYVAFDDLTNFTVGFALYIRRGTDLYRLDTTFNFTLGLIPADGWYSRPTNIDVTVYPDSFYAILGVSSTGSDGLTMRYNANTGDTALTKTITGFPATAGWPSPLAPSLIAARLYRAYATFTTTPPSGIKPRRRKAELGNPLGWVREAKETFAGDNTNEVAN